MHLNFCHINFLFLIFLFFGCARKQKNIFEFSRKEKIKINKLDLPIPKCLFFEKKGEDVYLFWKKIKKDFNVNNYKYKVTFLGYDIYRFVRSGFISRHPLNLQPIKTSNFCDKDFFKITKNYCYLVRAVFKIRNKIVHGPSSKIICIK